MDFNRDTFVEEVLPVALECQLKDTTSVSGVFEILVGQADDLDFFSLLSGLSQACGLHTSAVQPPNAAYSVILRCLSSRLSSPGNQKSKFLPPLIYLLGKLQEKGVVATESALVAEVCEKVGKQMLGNVSLFSSHELMSTVLSLGHIPEVSTRLCHLPDDIIEELLKRKEVIFIQNLSSVIKISPSIGLSRSNSEKLLTLCAQHICDEVISVASYTKMLLGVARLGSKHAGDCMALARFIAATIVSYMNDQLMEMQPDVLCGVIWALAELHGHGKHDSDVLKSFPTHLSVGTQKFGLAERRCSVSEFLLKLVEVAHARMPEFTPKEIAIISYRLGVLVPDEAAWFVTAAAMHATPFLKTYPPRTITDLCWAVSKLRSYQDENLQSFTRVVADTVLERFEEFNWQELARIILGLSCCKPKQSSATVLAQSVLAKMRGKCRNLDTQEMLHAILGASRLGVDTKDVQHLVGEVDALMKSSHLATKSSCCNGY